MDKQLTKEDIIKQIKKSAEIIAKERDFLRQVVQDAEMIMDSTDAAIIFLEDAIGTLSQYL